MFSKKTVYILLAVFAFLSISALIVNMPEAKDKKVMAKITPYFPYELTKTFGGLDIKDKRTGKRLKVANAKVFLAYDAKLKEWGKTHLKLDGDTLDILDDNGTVVDRMKLDAKDLAFVRHFFNF
ncbi:hypothetical protein [Hydrogenimonas sp. SS33]|uniref:hypothetical protein n=1 Tax=Hydrogenimonas leucolamina TaxID=2954236 RepID=UPI00336BFED7